MMIRRWIVAGAFIMGLGGSMVALALPPSSVQAACSNPTQCDAQDANSCNNSFLTFPAWYRGLPTESKNGNCNIKSPTTGKNGEGLSKFIWTIVLNIIDIALQLVGYISVGFIIYGGFTYIVWAGASDRIANARKMIINAVAGLVISLFAVAIINLVVNSF